MLWPVSTVVTWKRARCSSGGRTSHVLCPHLHLPDSVRNFASRICTHVQLSAKEFDRTFQIAFTVFIALVITIFYYYDWHVHPFWTFDQERGKFQKTFPEHSQLPTVRLHTLARWRRLSLIIGQISGVTLCNILYLLFVTSRPPLRTLMCIPECLRVLAHSLLLIRLKLDFNSSCIYAKLPRRLHNNAIRVYYKKGLSLSGLASEMKFYGESINVER